MKAAIILFASHFPHPLAVMLLSAIPVLEIRGALPVGILVWHMPWHLAYVYAVIGEVLVGIPLYFGLQHLRDFLIRAWPRAGHHFEKWIEDIRLKAHGKFEVYGIWTLFLLTAMPLPLTGIYSATVAAVLFEIPFKKAFTVMVLGVCVAGALILGMLFAGFKIIG